MKKLLLSLIALLSTVVAWAGVTDLPEITTDVNNPIYYTIYNTRSKEPGGLMYYAGDGVGLKDGCTALTLEDKYKFYFTGSHDAMYIHNAATTKKLASVSSWTDEGIAWELQTPTSNGVAVGPQGSDVNSQVWWNEKNDSWGDSKDQFTTWTADDAGSIFVFERADEYVFPETGKIYTIECPLFENVQGEKKGLYVKPDGSLAWGTVDLVNKNCYWTPTVDTDNNTVIWKNLGTEKYIGGTSMSDTEVTSTLKALGSNQFNIIAGGSTLHANGHGEGANAGSNIVSWGGFVNSASAWTFVERVNPDEVDHVTIIYNFTWKGTTKVTQSKEWLYADHYPQITVNLPYGVSVQKPSGAVLGSEAVENTITKNIEVTSTLPFTAYDSYDDITNWYYLKLHRTDKYYLYHDASLTYIDASKQVVDYENIDAYAWAFIGTPFDGFYLVNKAAGADKALISNDPTGSTNTGANVHPIIGDVAQKATWTLSKGKGDGIYIAYGSTGLKMNNRDKKLAYWTTGADDGSTFLVDDILEAELASAKAILGGIGTNPGYIEAESASALKSAVTALEEVIADGSNNYEPIVNIHASLSQLEVVLPTPGFYRILNNAGNGHLVPTADAVSSRAQFLADQGNTTSSVFYYDGTKLVSYETGMYLAADSGFVRPASTVGAGMQCVEFAGDYRMVGKLFVNFPNGNTATTVSRSLYSNGIGKSNAAGIANYNSNANYRFTVEPVTWLPIPVNTEVGYTTLYSPVQLAVTHPSWDTDDRVEVYTAETKSEGNYVTLVPQTAVPANVGVIIKPTANSKMDNGCVYLPVVETTTTDVESELKGTLADAYITPASGETCYILAKPEGKDVAMYRVALDQLESTAFVNNGFKAYLPVSGTNARSFIFNFDGTETGIEDIEGFDNALGNGNGNIFDLSGRRVKSAQKGVYIINGKKVIK